MTEPLISDEERKQMWSDTFNSFHGIVSAMDVTVEYAYRIEALVRKRLAERLSADKDELKLMLRTCERDDEKTIQAELAAIIRAICIVEGD